nr:type III-B CRISPR module RAMP protein Cmr4 [uncultured Undibacterium sp.]
MNALLYFIVTTTPTHVGCGQGLEDIDLPIQRSTTTLLPIFYTSTIKGVLRQHAPELWRCDERSVTTLFGAERDAAAQTAGMLTPQDARLLAMPVASLKGGWAWVSSRDQLRRLRQDALAAGMADVPVLPTTLKCDAILLDAQSSLRISSPEGDRVALLETVLVPDAESSDLARCWGDFIAARAYPDDDAEWRTEVASRFVIVSDATFTQMAKNATEVRARVSLDEDSIARDRSLWREECLPADTILWGQIGAQSTDRGAKDALSENDALNIVRCGKVQIGGKASVGYGLVDFLPQARPTGA